MKGTNPRRGRNRRSGSAPHQARQSPTPPGIDKSVLLVYLLSFFSGVAALIYEVTWARLLALTFGSTMLSAAAVVVGFLAGMGLGAVLYHRFRGHASRPLGVYVLLEYGIAGSTALLSLGFYALPEYFPELSRSIPSQEAYLILRFLIVLALIALPSILMGATFPALCRAAIHSAEGVNRRLGWIYGCNTLGAAGGALLAGLVLIEYCGLRGSIWVANGLNIAVGTAALVFLRRHDGIIMQLPGPMAIPTALPRKVTAAVLFLSGFATLAYEILWFRGLRYLVGSNNYAFSVILCTFLAGLGLGALLLDHAAHRRHPERDLVRVQCLTALLAVGGVGILAYILSSATFGQHFSIFMPEVRFSPWWQRLVIDLGVAMAILLPSTLFMGLSFPLAMRLYLGDVQRLDQRIGSGTLLANLGSAAGSIGAAMILLPKFGVVGGTCLIAGVNLAIALLVALALSRERGPALRMLGVFAVLVVVLSQILPHNLTIRGETLMAKEIPEEIFLREGDVATVQVLRDTQSVDKMAMAIDGFKIGWSEGFRGTPHHLKQTILADLPLVLDTRVRTTLSVGLGSAATLSTLASYPLLERLECVEISAAVVEASKFFEESRVLSDPRAELVVDDAIHHLLRADRRYDLVVSDGKQDPFFSGNAHLLCLEFYHNVSDHLTDRGMLVQWFPLSTLDSDLRTIVSTLSDVFPYLDAFYFPPFSLLLVAGKEPIDSRPHMSAEVFAQLPVSKRLISYGMDSPDGLLSNWVAGREALLSAAGEAPVSTWDRLILDQSPFTASLKDWQRSFPSNLSLILEASQLAGEIGAPKLRPEEADRRKSVRLLWEAWLARVEGREEKSLSLAEKALQVYPGNAQARSFVFGGLLKPSR